MHSLCAAPHASMYFDTRGKVRACCQARGEQLGDVRSASLREIWDGARTAAMRASLDAGQFPSACAFCAWQVVEGDDDVLFARGFDELPVADGLRWPTQMEFALTNTCNLRCVMCSGDFSSSIRSQREGRPPLPKAYDDAFFEELAEFLPHLTEAKFFGGEPLLGREPLRVLDMLADLEHPPAVTITTNATLLTPQIERVLAKVRPHLVISLDGASSATFDAIRLGARFDDVVANIARYRELVGAERISLTTCLMNGNWHEFPELLNLSSAWDTHLGVNVVHHPPEHSLFQLGAEALGEVVEALAARRPEVAADRVGIFDEQLAALRNRHVVVAGLGPDDSPGHGLPIAPFARFPGLTSRWYWLPFVEQGDTVAAEPGPPEPGPPDRGADLLVGSDGVVRAHGVVAEVPGALAAVVGAPVEDLYDLVAGRFLAAEHWHLTSGADGGRVGRHDVLLGGADDERARLSIFARRDPDGALVGARYRFELTAAGAARFGASPPEP